MGIIETPEDLQSVMDRFDKQARDLGRLQGELEAKDRRIAQLHNELQGERSERERLESEKAEAIHTVTQAIRNERAAVERCEALAEENRGYRNVIVKLEAEVANLRVANAERNAQ